MPFSFLFFFIPLMHLFFLLFSHSVERYKYTDHLWLVRHFFVGQEEEKKLGSFISTRSPFFFSPISWALSSVLSISIHSPIFPFARSFLTKNNGKNTLSSWIYIRIRLSWRRSRRWDWDCCCCCFSAASLFLAIFSWCDAWQSVSE